MDWCHVTETAVLKYIYIYIHILLEVPKLKYVKG